MLPALALIAALLLATLLALALVRFAPEIAPELPQPIRCRDCFDPDELLVYNASAEAPPHSRLRTSLRRAALLASALRQSPNTHKLRSRLLQAATTASRSHSTTLLDPILSDAAIALRQLSLTDLTDVESTS